LSEDDKKNSFESNFGHKLSRKLPAPYCDPEKKLLMLQKRERKKERQTEREDSERVRQNK